MDPDFELLSGLLDEDDTVKVLVTIGMLLEEAGRDGEDDCEPWPDMDAALEERVAIEELGDEGPLEDALWVDEGLLAPLEVPPDEDLADEEELDKGFAAEEDIVEACDEVVPCEELVGLGGTTTEDEEEL